MFVDYLQACLWRDAQLYDWRMGQGKEGLSLGAVSLLTLLVSLQQLPVFWACLFMTLPLLQSTVGSMKGGSLAPSSPASVFFVSLPVCCHPSVSLCLGAVPVPFA